MIIKYEDLNSLQKEKTVYVGGVFDLLHPGHIYIFKYIKKKLPDHKLVVGIMRNERVKILKGTKRPIMTDLERLEMVDAVKYVDFSFIYPITELDRPNWYEVPKRLKPEYIFAEIGSPIDPEKLKKIGITLVYFKKKEGISTTKIIERIKKNG